MKFKKHVTPHGEVLLYNGAPNLELLDVVSQEAGDLWHSSLDQGYTNCFQELMYQTAVFWWLLNDFENQNKAVCWRVNPFAFVIRETVWKQLSQTNPFTEISALHAFLNCSIPEINSG